MARTIARILMVLGFLLFLVSLFWGAANVNLPDVDATAEMIELYQKNERVALRIMQIGIALCCAGGLTRIVAQMLDRRK
jgi:hypothetical protein